MLRVGFALAFALPVAVVLFGAACTCGPSGPTNPDECNFRGDPGAEMRVLEIGYVPEPSDGMVSPEFVAYTPGVIVPKVRGFQGADMLTAQMRLAAGPDDPTGIRCVRVEYRRSGAGNARYDVEMEIVRQGDWWITRRAIFDPTEDVGTMMLSVTLEDPSFIATGAVSIELVGVD